MEFVRLLRCENLAKHFRSAFYSRGNRIVTTVEERFKTGPRLRQVIKRCAKEGGIAGIEGKLRG